MTPHNRTQKAAQGGKNAPVGRSAAPAAERRTWPLVPVPVVFFLLVWAFAGFYWGDMFRAARDYSFFAPDPTLMRFVWDKPYGSLWILGRALLCLFRYPVLGGAVLALMLTLISWLTGYDLRLPPRLRPLQYVPAGLLLGGMAYYGFDLYYEQETGMLLGVPLCLLIVLAVQALFIRSFSKKPAPALLTPPTDESRRQNLTALAAAVVLAGGPWLFAAVARPYVRETARMQRMLNERDWTGIIEEARKHPDPVRRPTAAIYAIALSQTGQLLEHLYDLRLEYEPWFLHGRTGETAIGSDWYETDGNYYAGLLQTAYSNALEHLTMEGPTLHMLKRLTRIALLQGHTALARKYLHILDQVPFEGDFVAEHLRYADHPEALEQEPETALLRQLEPIHDDFHTRFRKPLFLGYNIALLEGRSLAALHHSLAACLYSKDLTQTLIRLQPLRGQLLPGDAADAVAIWGKREPHIFNLFPGTELNQVRYRTFLQAIQPYAKERKERARELFGRYPGYYPYYYFFGNLLAPTHKDATAAEHKGVN